MLRASIFIFECFVFDTTVAEPCNFDDFCAMLVKLSTFNVPKVGRRATFESGRNSAKFWRHSAVSGLESCTPCLFILHVTTPVI